MAALLRAAVSSLALAAAARLGNLGELERLPPLGMLCRCEYYAEATERTAARTVVRDCVRLLDADSPVAAGLGLGWIRRMGSASDPTYECYTEEEVNQSLAYADVRRPSLSSDRVRCHKINADGARINDSAQAYLLPADALTLMANVTACSPANNKRGSPFSVFSRHALSTKKNRTLPRDKLLAPSPFPETFLRVCSIDEAPSTCGTLRCCTDEGFRGYACRYGTEIARLGLSLTTSAPVYQAVPEEVMRSLSRRGLDLGMACCQGEPLYGKLHQWECRDSVTIADLMWQAQNVPAEYQRYAVMQVSKRIYFEGILPLEKASLHEKVWGSPPLYVGRFSAKPMVILIGGYSTGKSSFIKNLVGFEDDLPGMRTGFEPTTDKFQVVQYGERRMLVQGDSFVTDTSEAFDDLKQFGQSFLGRLQATRVNSELLRFVTFVDTPGVLAGQVGRRDYDFDGVMRWFCSQATIVLFFFDKNRIDVAPELGNILNYVMTNPQLRAKTKFVLNKADEIEASSLMRVYASILWRVGQQLTEKIPAPRMFLGNFGNKDVFPYKRPDGHDHEFLHVFKHDYQKLLGLIHAEGALENVLPGMLRSLVMRISHVKASAYLMQYLRSQMPWWNFDLGWSATIVNELASHLEVVVASRPILREDLPDEQYIRQRLEGFDLRIVEENVEKEFELIEEAQANLETLINVLPSILAPPRVMRVRTV